MVKIIRAKTSLGSGSLGTELAPESLANSGLEKALKQNRINFEGISLSTPNAPRSVDQSRAKNKIELIQLNKNIYEETLSGLKKRKRVVVLGGDHSVAIGSMFATKSFAKDAIVIYIDAHPDSQSPETSLSGNIHGMPLSTVLGDALYDNFEYPPYKKSEVVLVGIKDIDHAEWKYIRKNKIKFFSINDIISLGVAAITSKILKIAGKKPVHISLDIDVIDAEYAPGTGIVNRGGLTYREIKYLCKKLSGLNIQTIDLVEINPKKDLVGKTSELGVEILIDLLGGDWSPYQKYINVNY